MQSPDQMNNELIRNEHNPNTINPSTRFESFFHPDDDSHNNSTIGDANFTIDKDEKT